MHISHMRDEASGVLDSAVRLARTGYGPQSDAFAEANVAASLAHELISR